MSATPHHHGKLGTLPSGMVPQDSAYLAAWDAVPAGWKHQHLHCGCTDKGSSQPNTDVPVSAADGAGLQLVATELNCLGILRMPAQISTDSPAWLSRRSDSQHTVCTAHIYHCTTTGLRVSNECT